MFLYLHLFISNTLLTCYQAAKKLSFFDKAQTWAILGQLYYTSSKNEQTNNAPSSPPVLITSYVNQTVGRDNLSRLLEIPGAYLK